MSHRFTFIDCSYWSSNVSKKLRVLKSYLFKVDKSQKKPGLIVTCLLPESQQPLSLLQQGGIAGSRVYIQTV